LNWFPAQKASWLAQRATEYAQIEIALNTASSSAVEDDGSQPDGFQLQQNYPNPFNQARR